MLNKHITGAYWVPGLPHILKPELNDGYKKLNDACGSIAKAIKDSGAERILYYSTNWLSVLGTSFQAKKNLEGYHVDENWHDLVDLPFKFTVDQQLSESMRACSQKAGFATAATDFEGFPVDTGTIVADTLINKAGLAVGMVSSGVYLDHEATTKLGAACCEGIKKSGKKTALVLVSGLSGRYFTREIDLREDHIRDPADEQWNQKMISLLCNKDFTMFEQNIAAFASETKADMGLKAYAFAKGVLGDSLAQASPALAAYSSIYGTGAAVIDFNLS